MADPKMESPDPKMESLDPKMDQNLRQFSENSADSGRKFKEFMCEYCNNIYSTKSNKVKHLKICKERKREKANKNTENILKEKYSLLKKTEQMTKQFNEETKKLKYEKEVISKQFNEETEKLKQEIREIEKEYLDFMKSVAKNNISSTTINNNNTVNMYYIINNYTEAYNYEDLMKKPLTEEEIRYISEKGALAGCYNLIANRCINGVELERRPLHCVDTARNKYLLRKDDDWLVDEK